jgi:hypothetical protein
MIAQPTDHWMLPSMLHMTWTMPILCMLSFQIILVKFVINFWKKVGFEKFIDKTLVVGNDSTTHRPLDVAKYVTYDLNHAHFMYVKCSDHFSKICD